MDQAKRRSAQEASENDFRAVQGRRGRALNRQEDASISDASVFSASSVTAKLRNAPVTGGKLEGRTRICDLSVLELKRLCEFPDTCEMESAMETMARVAFYVKEDEVKLRRILKAIKTMQDVMSEE